MKSFFYLLTILGGILAIPILLYSLVAPNVMQQATVAATAVALVVIPYCMARAFEKFRQEPIAKTLERLLRTDQEPPGRT